MEGVGGDYQVAIVDDDPVVRRSMELFIAHIVGFQVSATFESGDLALAALINSPPHVVLLDLRMPGISGWDCARKLIAEVPQTRVIIVTSSSSQADFYTSLTLGLHGYLLKPPTMEGVRLALVASLAGFHVAPHELNRAGHVRRNLANSAVRTFTLSATERRIIELMRLGYKDTRMAEELAISVNTLRTHLKRLFKKLGVHSRAEVFARFDHATEVRR